MNSQQHKEFLLVREKTIPENGSKPTIKRKFIPKKDNATGALV